MFDEPSDTPLNTPREPVPPSATLIFDGLFLHRPELLGYWDVTVFLRAEARRDREWQQYLMTDLPRDATARAAELERRIGRARRDRYVDGQRMYESVADPSDAATFVLDNDDLERPRLLRNRRGL